MKKLFCLFALLNCFCFSCSEDSEPLEACATENVLADLPWLVELIEEQEQSPIGKSYSFISKGRYKSKTVIILQNCCPNCNSIFPVYDCSGDFLDSFGPGGIESDEIKDLVVIWKSSQNSCNFSS